MGIKNLFKKKQTSARPIPVPPKPPHFHGLTELPNLSPLDDMPSLDSFGLGELPEIMEDETEAHTQKPLPPKPPMPQKPDFRPLPVIHNEPVYHEAAMPPSIRHEAPMPAPIYHPLPAPAPKPDFRPAPAPQPRFVPDAPKPRILPPRQEHLEKPFFVKVDDYRSILEGTTLIKNNLKEADEIISRLNELKNEGDREFEKWREKLEDVQRKLIYVDKVIFEAG